MEPLINPWIIYLAGISESTVCIAAIVAGFCGLAIIFHILAPDCFELRDSKKFLYTIFVVSMLIGLFMPSKETALQMIAASMITKDNITYVEDNTAEFVGKITKVMDTVEKQSKK